MRRAAIVCPVRTPVGTFGGALKDVPVEVLGSIVVKAVLDNVHSLNKPRTHRFSTLVIHTLRLFL